MTAEYASFDDLSAPSVEGAEGEDMTLPSGKLVRVRGLSRYEWFMVGKAGKNQDGDAAEVALLRLGMINPRINAAQGEKWRKTPGVATDVAAVLERIRDLTGLSEGANKSDVPAIP